MSDLIRHTPATDTVKTVTNSLRQHLLGALMGAAVGDALGVPHEFAQREIFYDQSVSGMDAYGTHDQPQGTWSDDTSMTLATAHTIAVYLQQTPQTQQTADLPDAAFLKTLIQAFLRWMQQGEYSPHGEVFDIGNTTHGILMEYVITPDFEKAPLTLEGAEFEDSQGNGSLMRLLPIALWNMLLPLPQSFMDQVSCITHGHPRVLSICQHYLDTVSLMFQHGFDPIIGIQKSTEAAQGRNALYVPDLEVLIHRPEYQIKSSGYIIDTIEAVYWCMHQQGTYANKVLRAVNLGGDTDTIASIVGGLAGLQHGIEAIPTLWLQALQKPSLLQKTYQAYVQQLTTTYSKSTARARE